MVRSILQGLTAALLLALPAAARPAAGGESPHVAHWFQDREGAVSLRFDDGGESHITIVMPLLRQYGLTATFMVNPGRSSYREHRDFWEREVPASGSRLGDHTMHHRGARTVEAADYEIGEAARIIRRADPARSGLLAFASGGGKKWGGKDWEHAAPAFRALVGKYHLVDLYDGSHASHLIDGSSTVPELCSLVNDAAERKRYQPFHAHTVGEPTLSDRIRKIVRGTDLVVPTKTLAGLFSCIAERRSSIWVAPITDIVKYEREYRGVKVTGAGGSAARTVWRLEVATDPALYDQLLTLILKPPRGERIRSVVQDGQERHVYQQRPGEYLSDVRPVNSVITVLYEKSRNSRSSMSPRVDTDR